MKISPTSLLACLSLALALVLSGCSADTRSEGRVALGLATDKAYLTILTAQNAVAIAYSEAILKNEPSARLANFAEGAIAARNQEAVEIEKLQAKDSDPAQFTLPNAAEQLGLTFRQLALSGDGALLAEPRSESEYVKAMKSNAKGVLKATEPETEHGSPGVVPFSKQVALRRTDELDSLRNFQ